MSRNALIGYSLGLLGVVAIGIAILFPKIFASDAYKAVTAVQANDSGENVPLAEGTWTILQELSLVTNKAGYVHLSAYGGEPVATLLPNDSWRFSSSLTLVGIGAAREGKPLSPVTFDTGCCGDRPRSYRVSAYYVGAVYRIEEPGTYRYTVYAWAHGNADGITSIRPGDFVAMFLPD